MPSKNEKPRRSKPKAPLAHRLFPWIMVLMPCILVVGIFSFFFQLKQLEGGILDVCATQQDAYVELVLSQINLKENRDSAEIISEILNTLDSSSNKYWTFSSQQTMLFVKDVLETNRYKGFTASSYYSSESASTFFQSLQLNRVTHTNIIVDGKDYVASGVAFQYQGRPYKLCLLTNSRVLLDNNAFLGSTSQMSVLFLLMMGLLTILPMTLAILLRNLQRKEDRSEEIIRQMNDRLSELGDRLARQDIHDTRTGTWSAEALPQFLQGLKNKDAGAVTLMRIRSSNAEERERFLSMSRYTLDHRVLRFNMDDSQLILLFLGVDKDQAVLSVIPLLTTETVMVKTVSVGDPGAPSPEDAAQLLMRSDDFEGR